MDDWSFRGAFLFSTEEEARHRFPLRCAVCGDAMYQWAGGQGYLHAVGREGRQCGMRDDTDGQAIYVIDEQTLI